ncbi:unnamed protein product [Effrenium voratum]|uniref:Uncharacterized protein n=1 Tax=Effrenium voratum TaxID=2562239 RepID=A0AA36IA66_9DINO|nr:unnamed protein product [Effrenium voratum]
MYHPASDTWMTPKDKLTALGFPTTPETAIAMGVPILPVADVSSASGRRIETEHYNGQTTYKDCHLLDWLESADPTWLQRDVFKGARRAKLFSALAFNFGWLPSDLKLSDLKSEVQKGAASQYERRNRPAAHTGWGPDEMHAYTKYQLRQFAQNKLKRRAIGGYSWLLPAKSSTGEPAPLPDEVLKMESKASGSKPKRDKAKRERSDSSECGSQSSKSNCEAKSRDSKHKRDRSQRADRTKMSKRERQDKASESDSSEQPQEKKRSRRDRDTGKRKKRAQTDSQSPAQSSSESAHPASTTTKTTPRVAGSPKMLKGMQKQGRKQEFNNIRTPASVLSLPSLPSGSCDRKWHFLLRPELLERPPTL